jgi:uncharacterized protein
MSEPPSERPPPPPGPPPPVGAPYPSGPAAPSGPAHEPAGPPPPTGAPVPWPAPPSGPPTWRRDVGDRATGTRPAYHRIAQRPRGAWWRLVVSIVGAAVGLVVGTIVAVLVVFAGARLLGFEDFSFDLDNGIDAGEMFATNAGLALLIPIAGLLYYVVHQRGPRWLSSTTPGLRVGWLLRCVWMAAIVWALFLVLGTVSAYVDRDSPVDSAVAWFLVVVILTTPLQAAGEEYLFRGLLLQSLGATRLPTWVCCVGSAALFATAHLQFAPPLFADRFVLGLVLAWVAIRTGGLEAGIAIHAVKNLSALIPAALVEQVEDTLDPTGVTWLPLALDVVLLSIFLPWLFAAYRRRLQQGSGPPG